MNHFSYTSYVSYTVSCVSSAYLWIDSHFETLNEIHNHKKMPPLHLELKNINGRTKRKFYNFYLKYKGVTKACLINL